MRNKSKQSKAHLALPRLIDVGPGHRLYKVWCRREQLGDEVVAALAAVSRAASDLRAVSLPPMSQGLADNLEQAFDILEKQLMVNVR